jgi:hypothetical protein
MKYNKSHGIHQAGFLLEIQWQNTWYNSDLNYYFFIILSCSGGNLGFPIRIYYWLLVSNWNLKHKICTGPMSISTKFAIKWFSSFRKEDETMRTTTTCCKSITKLYWTHFVMGRNQSHNLSGDRHCFSSIVRTKLKTCWNT